ncbi:MAG TPA: SRPBCC family protein [Xanthomonadaceae bacterium]|jgi:hypothetical protein
MNFGKIPPQLLWIPGGALYGLLMRWLFGTFSSALQGPMSIAFLIGTPFVVGALTIYGMRRQDPSVTAMMFAPWLSILLMFVGCALSMMEGLICLAMMLPFFLFFATMGGLVMGTALRLLKEQHAPLRAVAVLPFLLVLADRALPMPDRQVEVHQSIEVHASPHTIWQQILTARDIRPDELPFSVSHFIGVPKPVEGINRRTPEGEVRFSRWERGVHFEGIVTDRQEDRSITWRYRFGPHSFPPGSMDDHVAVGGRYFDLGDTSFQLTPMPGGTTRVDLVAHYRVSSSINFYAVPVAKFLGRDFEHTILALYKRRSERAEGGTGVAGAAQ